MKSFIFFHRDRLPWIAGILVGALVLFTCIGVAWAASPSQDAGPTPTPESEPAAPTGMSDQDCKECHLDIAKTWSTSPHAHAFDDPHFQEHWAGLGNSSDCLLCHTTNYQATDNSYTAEGVSCEACHGKVDANHPPEVAPILADTEYCGTCHTTTLHEWRLTGHASAGVGCMDCHDPHSQGALFEVSDDLCINCHKDDMGPYLEDLHIQKGIGCVDCHALVIPPEVEPQDGIVPTGHTFTITPATCVACHSDVLHAGFSLPGYENGATTSMEITATLTSTLGVESSNQAGGEPEAGQSGLSSEQRIQALETKLASRQLSTLFQGGIIGLVLGGMTAWFVANNTRRTFMSTNLSEETQAEEPAP